MPSIMVTKPSSHNADPTAVSALVDREALLRDDVGAMGATPPESPGVHHKAPPVCLDRTLQSSAMTTQGLAQLAFPSSSDAQTAAVPAPPDDATRRAAARSDSAPTTTAATTTNKAVEGLVLSQPSPPHHPHPTSTTMVPTGVVDLPMLAIPVSSSSSTCTRESDTLSDAEGGGGLHHCQGLPHLSHTIAFHGNPHATLKNSTPVIQVVQPPLLALPSNAAPSDATAVAAAVVVPPCTTNTIVPVAASSAAPADPHALNAKVSRQKTSRQGRSTQRWMVDGTTHETVRLVTGCVPILKTGQVLFVSSSRQSEWILPKGGWEQDEALEESAIRECFEEAGVLGTLGPPLHDVQYETRKAKKRRLEQEELRTKKSHDDLDLGSGESAVVVVPSVASTAPAVDHPAPSPEASSPSAGGGNSLSSPTGGANPLSSPISREDLCRIRWMAQQSAPKASDETLSVASNVSGTHSQVRMTLFPLYVTHVHDTWPECGRLRTAVDIDQAIRMMDARPEFKVALQEVKDRGLHLCGPAQQPQQPPREEPSQQP